MPERVAWPCDTLRKHDVPIDSPFERPRRQIEREFGVPVPGDILPEGQWTQTAIKHLPAAGPLDFPTIFGRIARFKRVETWNRSFLGGCFAGGHPICDTSC